MSASKVPASLVESIREFHEELRLNRVTEILHFQGAYTLFRLPGVQQFLGAFDISQPNLTYTLAEQERISDFRHFRRIFLVHLWSSLEHLIFRTIYRLIEDKTFEIDNDQIIKLQKTANGDNSANEEWYVKRIPLQFKGITNAIDKFEAALSGLGLPNSGVPPDNLADNMKIGLNELYHIRNCVVHRRSKVDKQLLSLAPSLHNRCILGELIPVDSLQSILYEVAVIQYAFSVYVRVYKRYGADEENLREDIKFS